MLIPSIDLMGGRVVQLEQGERLAMASDDLEGWIARFTRFPIVQLVDLDAARGSGDNRRLVERVCAALPCQVGGGVRSVEQARALIDGGARRIIVGSALFTTGGVNLEAARTFSDALGPERLIAAIDSRGNRVTIDGWRTQLAIRPEDAIGAFSGFAGGFLYTDVDVEGLLLGVDLERVAALRALTSARLIAAGGIRNADEVDSLHAIGVDAVVGMAIYRGLIDTGGPTG
jgi:phosphoribosylformimino-5-aminoimidazole carboxamide ribotide isomerase